jgi:hypothetical protein
MKVLIVAKTHMSDAACVGGIIYDTCQSVRLLQADGSNQPGETDFEVGDVWDLEYRRRPDPIPPHVEDILVYQKRYSGKQASLQAFLARKIKPWEGGPQHLFDGLIRFTQNGSGYISKRTGVPNCSTGYWLSDRPLTQTAAGDKVRYQYRYANGSNVCITYVGFFAPIETIEKTTLVRVSLARWWAPSPDVEQRCYLQLSGWYS